MNFIYDKFFNKRGILAVSIFAFVLIVWCFYVFKISPPRDFPTNKEIIISNGMGLTEIANSLEDQKIIRSKFWFVNFVLLFNREQKIVGGEYYFERPENVYRVARKLVSGKFGIEQLKTVIPEGSNANEIADIIKKNYPDFDKELFISLAKSKEGYLFPDSYYFGTKISPEKTINTMTDNFDRKIKNQELERALKSFDKPLSDVVKMASILEEEARQMETRRIIAGILWERIRIKMPLQVDVSFVYLLGKGTDQLTAKDLKTKSPYNSYTNLGLPPTPISNPGIASIIAATTPIKSDYLYFLSDKNGIMHYARTLDEHVANKQKYLR